MSPRRDACGHGVWDYYVKREGSEIIEREGGLLDPSSVAPKAYFAEFRQWPEVERKGIVRATGRVLDVGCGAGRVSVFRGRRGMCSASIALRWP